MATKRAREEAAKAIDGAVPGVFYWVDNGVWRDRLFASIEAKGVQDVHDRLAEAIDSSVAHALDRMGEAAEDYRRDFEFVKDVETVADRVRVGLGMDVDGDGNG